MGLFGGAARKREREQLVQSWRGSLNAGVWAEGQERYFEVARELEFKFAEAALARKFGDPLPREAAALARKLMPATGADGVPPLEDGARTAYLVSHGETWEELGVDQLRRLARECCAAAAEDGVPEADGERMRAGTAILGFVSNHPEHPQPMLAFQPLHERIAQQGSFERLNAAGRSFASETAQVFRSVFPSGTATAEQRYRLAWQLGLGIWVWEQCGWLRNPALDPVS